MKKVDLGLFNKEAGIQSHLFYSRVLQINLAVLLSLVLFILAAVLLAASSKAAQPVVMSDAELAGVTGQAGISVNVNMSMTNNVSVAKYSDTDTGQWLEFHNYTVDNGSGGAYLIQTTLDDPVTVDVGTNDAGRTLVAYRDTSRTLPRWYSVGDMVFCNQSLGSLNLDAFTMGPSTYRVGAHADGTGGGYDFDFATRVYAQAFRYKYNTTPETLTFSGIHLVGSATGAADNPADPTTWSFAGTGNNFRIGDIDNANPAKFDVVTDSTGVTSLVLNLPMEGSLRVENVVFGGNAFGPIAIDGIKVHRLTLEIR